MKKVAPVSFVLLLFALSAGFIAVRVARPPTRETSLALGNAAARAQRAEPHYAGAVDSRREAGRAPIKPENTETELRSLAEELGKTEADLCRLNSVSWEKFSLGTVAELLGQPGSGAGENPAVEKYLHFLAARTPAEAAGALAGSSHPGLRFLRALSLGGLMVGGAFGDEPPAIDHAESRRLLLSLARDEPRNAAIPFFLAAVEEKSGLPDASIRARFRQAMALPSFDLHLVSLWQELFLAVAGRPAYFFPAWAAMANAPFPRFAEPSIHLKKLLAGAPDLDEKVAGFAEMLAKETERNYDYPESTFFEYAAYGISRGLLRQSYRNAGRDEADLPAWAQKRAAGELYGAGLDSLRTETLLVPRDRCRNERIAGYVNAFTEQIRDHRWRVAGN